MEARQGAFPVTHAFLRLTAAALEAHHTAGPLPAYVAFATNMLLAQQQLRFASAAQQGELLSACLAVINAALGAGAQATFVPGTADGSRRLSISRAGALAAATLCQHASSYLGAVLPPPAEQVSQLLQQQPASAEADAVLRVADGLLTLLPQLLAAAAASPGLLRPLLAYLLGDGAGPAQRLLSYLTLSADPGLLLKALQLLAALAAVAAAPEADPLALAALVPRGSPVASHLSGLFESQYVRCYPELFEAAAQLLLVAIPGLPALLAALMYPCGLEQQAGGSGAGGGAAAGAAGAKSKGKASRVAAFSVVDGLWALVQEAGELLEEEPCTAALALQVGPGACGWR